MPISTCRHCDRTERDHASGSQGDDGRQTAARPRCPRRRPLTERQEARRRRILHASAQLASRGGFDAVQMREVAESSQVALGTLYRYFPSKVHLLVATMQDQLQHMHGRCARRPPTGRGRRRSGSPRP